MNTSKTTQGDGSISDQIAATRQRKPKYETPKLIPLGESSVGFGVCGGGNGDSSAASCGGGNGNVAGSCGGGRGAGFSCGGGGGN